MLSVSASVLYCSAMQVLEDRARYGSRIAAVAVWVVRVVRGVLASSVVTSVRMRLQQIAGWLFTMTTYALSSTNLVSRLSMLLTDGCRQIGAFATTGHRSHCAWTPLRHVDTGQQGSRMVRPDGG